MTINLNVSFQCPVHLQGLGCSTIGHHRARNIERSFNVSQEN